MAREGPATLAQVDADGAGDAAGRNAEMAVEPLILGCDHGILEVRRNRIRGDLAAELFAAPGEHLSVSVEQRDRALGAGVKQVRNRRQGGGVVENGPGDGERNKCGHAPANSPDKSHDG